MRIYAALSLLAAVAPWTGGRQSYDEAANYAYQYRVKDDLTGVQIQAGEQCTVYSGAMGQYSVQYTVGQYSVQ